jgi:hypothetical protein
MAMDKEPIAAIAAGETIENLYRTAEGRLLLTRQGGRWGRGQSEYISREQALAWCLEHGIGGTVIWELGFFELGTALESL